MPVGRRAGLTAISVICLPLLLSACASQANVFAFMRPAQIDWSDTRWCVPLPLRAVLKKVARNFGPVTVHSTHRWPAENRRKGGKPKSYHLTCRAVDFSVEGDPQGVLEFLKAQPSVGGYSRYPQGFYHIDNGPRRTW